MHTLALALIFTREVTDEKEQSDRLEKLITLKQEYERYKDLWGLNLQYSHSSGPAQNYSELTFDIISILLFFSRLKEADVPNKAEFRSFTFCFSREKEAEFASGAHLL